MRWADRISRRRFLAGAAAAGAGSLVPWRLAGWAVSGADLPMLDPASIAQFIDPLPVPAVWSTSELAARGLTMAPGAHRFSSSLGETPTWGYGGAAYLGPTIQAQKGSPVSFTARNRLGPHPLAIDLGLHGPTVEDIDRPRVSLHLHGGYTEPASDGYPEDTFRPGEDHVYDYAEDQQAGTICTTITRSGSPV